jgi:hypothetical protein
MGLIATYATTNLLLQHPNKTLATYLQKQIKRLQYMYRTLAKHTQKLENTCVAIAKHM